MGMFTMFTRVNSRGISVVVVVGTCLQAILSAIFSVRTFISTCSAWLPFELPELPYCILWCNKHPCLHSTAEPTSCKTVLFMVFLIWYV